MHVHGYMDGCMALIIHCMFVCMHIMLLQTFNFIVNSIVLQYESTWNVKHELHQFHKKLAYMCVCPPIYPQPHNWSFGVLFTYIDVYVA